MMQYLLTFDEYNRMVPKHKLEQQKNVVHTLRKMLVGDKCIHHPNFKGSFGYCDDKQCPIALLSHAETNRLCSLEKRWGK